MNHDTSPSPNFNYRTVIWIIVALGILLRLYHLVYNRSLWEDEIYLTTGLVNYDLHDVLTKPLHFQQKAPLGYLLIVKLIITVFGNHEIPLRLFSFICGVLSLVLFVPVARHFLKSGGTIAAVALLAFAPPVLYHGVEAKQYAVELFSTVLVLYLYIRYHDHDTLRKRLAWGLWGAVIVWFSFASVFVMAALAAAIGITQLLQKRFNGFIALLPVYALWFGSFIVNYVLFTHKDTDTGWLIFFFVKHEGFMPLSAGAIRWIAERMVSFLNYPLGLSWMTVYNAGILEQALQRMIFVPLLLALAGIYQLYTKNRQLLLFVIFSFVIVMLASALKMYPFHERLTLFLAPVFIVLLASGCDLFAAKRFYLRNLQFVLIIMLLFGPVKNTIAQACNPYLFGDYKKSYQREALLYLNEHYQPGDVVYVYWNNLPGYRLYKQMYPLKYTAIEGLDHRHQARDFTGYFKLVDADLDALRGKKRVWIVQNNNIDIPIGDYIGDPAYYYQFNDGPKRFHDHVLRQGKLLDQYKPADKRATSDIGVMLLDMSR